MLNVSSNLNNSFFAQTFNCVHRTQTINAYGETILNETSFTISASIQPTSGRELDFLPESALLTENITIYSKDILVSSVSSGYGDIVIYENQRYQVIKVKAWPTHYEAIASMEGLSE
jgi:hypothetical protein